MWFLVYIGIGLVCVVFVATRYGLKWGGPGEVTQAAAYGGFAELIVGSLILLGAWLLLWPVLLPLRLIREASKGGRAEKVRQRNVNASMYTDAQLARWASEIESAATVAGHVANTRSVLKVISAHLAPDERVLGCFTAASTTWLTSRALFCGGVLARIDLSDVTHVVEQGCELRVVHAGQFTNFVFGAETYGPNTKAQAEVQRMAAMLQLARAASSAPNGYATPGQVAPPPQLALASEYVTNWHATVDRVLTDAERSGQSTACFSCGGTYGAHIAQIATGKLAADWPLWRVVNLVYFETPPTQAIECRIDMARSTDGPRGSTVVGIPDGNRPLPPPSPDAAISPPGFPPPPH